MDRFIDTKEFRYFMRNSDLKSNMDRFIDNIIIVQ